MQKILTGHLSTLAKSIDYDLPAPLPAKAGCGSNENGFIRKMSWCSLERLERISRYLITWESGCRFHRIWDDTLAGSGS